MKTIKIASVALFALLVAYVEAESLRIEPVVKKQSVEKKIILGCIKSEQVCDKTGCFEMVRMCKE